MNGQKTPTLNKDVPQFYMLQADAIQITVISTEVMLGAILCLQFSHVQINFNHIASK